MESELKKYAINHRVIKLNILYMYIRQISISFRLSAFMSMNTENQIKELSRKVSASSWKEVLLSI